MSSSTLTRVLGRVVSRKTVSHLLFPSPAPSHLSNQQLPALSLRFHSLSSHLPHKASSFNNGLRCSTTFTYRGMSTSSPPEQEQESRGDATNPTDENASEKSSTPTQETGTEVDLDDLSKEDVVKVLFEKEELLQKKEKEFAEWKDKFLRSYAEIENVMERTKRDAENSKKFAVQSFAKSLLDVADNLSRASSVTKESFSKIDVSQDTIGAVPVLKTLLDGVEMTEKQLAEVFRKSGIEKIDPTGEQFDPNLHNAVFQVPDGSKPPNTIAVVLKAGYTLHGRMIRPAEVGVTVAVENNEADS